MPLTPATHHLPSRQGDYYGAKDASRRQRGKHSYNAKQARAHIPRHKQPPPSNVCGGVCERHIAAPCSSSVKVRRRNYAVDSRAAQKASAH